MGFTDNEIIKGINYCANVEHRKNCDNCPIKAVCDSEDYGAIKLVNDLINRQKAEIDALRKTILDADYSSITALKAKESWHMENSEYIDRLKEEIEKLRKRVNFVEQANVQLREELKETTEKFNCQQYVYADLSDIIRDKNAEIEGLKNDCFCISNERDAIGDCLNEAVEEAKSEAIKEFAKRLKSDMSYSYLLGREFCTDITIDNLVKEMVGEG